MADDADRAQAQAEWMEEYRQRHSNPKRPVARLTDECMDCGDLIEAARIKAMPTALRCIECENFYQHILKRHDR